MARSNVARRPRGRETTPDRPSGLRLWLRRRRGMVRPTLYGLALAGVVGGAAVGVMALDPAGRFATLLGGVSFDVGSGVGLVVKQVTLEGRQNAPLEELRRALGVQRGDPILAFSPQAAKERLEANAWVAQADVERRLPDTILIRIQERQPYAIWQNNGAISVIDKEGRVISDRIDEFGLLPWVVGAGANQHAAQMIDLLRTVPELRDRAEALIRVGNRRWNIRLRSGTEIRLPEGLEEAALRRLQEQQRAMALLDRPVAVIDLRLPDKLTVQVAPPTSASGASSAPAPAESAQRARSARG
jgi:cell division protein FtsQ